MFNHPAPSIDTSIILSNEYKENGHGKIDPGKMDPGETDTAKMDTGRTGKEQFCIVQLEEI